MTSSDPTEAETRQRYIDKALERAGWHVADAKRVGQEIPVDGFDPKAWQARQSKIRGTRETGVDYEVAPPAGVSDYLLYRDNGEVLAVVEAKRTSRDPRIAQAQTEFYVAEIAKRQSFPPFAFMTNGHEIYFLDRSHANKRLVSGFFTETDLLDMLHTRDHGEPLATVPINTTITDRDYQIEAIRRVTEAFDRGQRKALLVMATGTGKTRTVMSLIDVFLRAQQAQRILFVADRDALVKQAMTEGFHDFLPDEPCTRIVTRSVDLQHTQRLYAATLQTLSNCYQHFSPAFFDLIIFDEVHRSIFNKWNEVLHYFDARMIGLTATPADFIERNTFLEFECRDQVPTFLYTYAQAIRDGHLVDFNLYVANTRFQRTGIHGVDLSEEERNQLLEQGLDPDQIDYEGTELERTVSNTDTLRDQWQEFMDVCVRDESGQLPGKTIVFAMTQSHAFRLLDTFEEMYPQFPGLARVITHEAEYKGNAIKAFKQEELPRIAISVDMLDTGINVPEVVNLVFMRPVHSRIKLEQMIGRGTRNQAACSFLGRLPAGCKESFQIIDFWENDFNRDPDKNLPQSLPVLVTIFNTRLSLLERRLNDQQSLEAIKLVVKLRGQIDEIPRESYAVQRRWPQVQVAWEDGFWRRLTQDKLDFLRLQVAPLLRYAATGDMAAATFTSKVERLRLGAEQSRDIDAAVNSIADDVGRLPDFVFENAAVAAVAQRCLSGALANATPAEYDEVIDTLAANMRFRAKRRDNLIVLDLADAVELRGYIILTKRNERLFVEEYQRRVEERILDLVAGHPTIAAIEREEPVTTAQLIDLERTLRHDLANDDLEISPTNIRRAYGLKVDSFLAFLRHIFELNGLPDYRELVEERFDAYMAANPFSADQLRFLRTVKTTLARRQRLTLADLYEAPFTGFGRDAVERYFKPVEVEQVLDITQALSIE